MKSHDFRFLFPLSFGPFARSTIGASDAFRRAGASLVALSGGPDSVALAAPAARAEQRGS